MDALQHTIIDPLQPFLKPITQNLPAPINDFALNLLGEVCHSSLLLDLDILAEPHCLSLAISKALGIAIISASAVVKVPQLIKLVKSGSAEGLSFVSYALETTAFLITLAYNVRQGFPFSTYGETSFLLIQDVLITTLILVYSGKASQGLAFVFGILSAGYALLFGGDVVPDSQMATLQAGAGVLSVASKVPQIATIWAAGGTGQLSAFAVFNYLVGSLSRIFTTLQEVDDKLILGGFVAGFALNAIIAAQMVYYWNSPVTAGHGSEVGGWVGQKGVQGMATEETLKKEGVPLTPKGVSTGARPSSAGRRRG